MAPVPQADNTEQLPPYNYEENGTLKGIAVDLLGEITGKMGRRVTPDQVHLVPWTEGYQAALTRNGTVLFSMERNPERESSFKWAGPIATHRDVLFARPDRGIVIRDPADLKGYRIGVIADDAVIRELLDNGVEESQLVIEGNVSAIIAGLESGKIDLWGYPEGAGRYFTGQLTGNEYSFTVVYELGSNDLYYAFSRDVPDETVQSFQAALDALRAEKDATGVSTYDRIMGRYIPSLGLARLQYLTEEWAPFNYLGGGRPSGIAVEILEEVFRNAGVNRTRSDVRIVPLAEGFRQAQGNTGTVLFSIARTPEREPLYPWVGPFTRSAFVVYAPLNRSITITSAGDLNRYRIGAVETSIENSLLASQGVNASQILPGAAPADLFRMLKEGKIDLWATGDLTGRYEMMKTGANPNAYEIVYTLGENDFYYIFSRDVPEPLVSSFRQALGNVRNQKDARGISGYERIIYRNLGVGCTRQSFTDAEVMALVNTTVAAIGKNAPDTLRRINAGEAPYRDPGNPALYAFVYDTNATIVAHADNIRLVGVNYRGKTDVSDRPFRDEIVAGALEKGSGWEEYIYVHPVQTNLFYKTTYYRLTRGSDGKLYIVCSGNFKACG
ncbi:MAG: transporter substrate-binding domain-containing protein [Methanomicrobiales archaeon]|nr:transporter substrate-binding domain-containing protein [Methanomicrobiales archaeon]